MEYAIMPLKSTVNDVIATSGFDAIDMRHDTLFGSREDAQAAIEAAADPCAVRFKCVALDTLEPTVTMNQIADRIRRMSEQRDKYTDEHSIHTLSAKLITCTKCDSRIAKDWVEGEFCPVCGNDLRSPYIPAQIATYNEKIADMEQQIADARERQVKRALAKGEVEARLMWLVPLRDTPEAEADETA